MGDFFITFGWLCFLILGAVALVAIFIWIDERQSQSEAWRRALVAIPLFFTREKLYRAWLKWDFTTEQRMRERERKLLKYIKIGLQ